MNSNLALAIEFADKIKDNKNVLQIVLFGSVARGEDTLQSDVDIAIIHNNKDKFKIMQDINKYKPEKVQITFLNIKDLPKEPEIIGALNGDGILLYGRPITIQQKKLKLTTKILLSYSLAKLPQTEKVKVNRALYGSVSKSKLKDKEYITETKGFVHQIGVEKINDGVLLVDQKIGTNIKAMLKRFGASYKEIVVWTY